MHKEATSWISEYSKEAYAVFCRIDSFQDRFRNLIPLYAALGTGYYFMGTRFPHSYSDGNLAFFYIPYAAGLVLLIASIYLILYSMFWLVNLEMLGDPAKFYETCESINENESDEKVKMHLDVMTAKERCKLSSGNRERFKRRSKLLIYGARIGVISFALLALSAPRFISTSWHHSQANHKS
jgi:hypothetical protein